MSHQRTNIRNALLALIKGSAPSYNTNAGANVFSNRQFNLSQSKLPAIKIGYEEENAIPRDIRSSIYNRTLPVKIEVLVESTSGYDTSADDICKQIEDLLSVDRSITGTASTSIYTGTKFEIDVSGEKPIMVATLNYEINYLT